MSRHRILIVDDEQMELDSWKKALELANFNVMIAQDAKTALKLSDEHTFDLVLSDFIMPSMTGIELLGKIRKRQPLIRSIIVSGKIDPDVDEDTITNELRTAVEADIYLHKPVSNDRLKEAINQLLERTENNKEWVEIANMSVKANKTTVAATKKASRNLKKFAKKKK